LERLNAAVRAGDIKRLALVLCRVPAHALEQGLVAGWGAPPLHLAASEGQVDACVLLLQRNALAEGHDGRARTPLMLALERGHSECACMLLAHTTALEAKCDSGTTALHRAVARGLGAPLAQLLARKADVASRDAGGRTAVHIACLAGEVVALVQLLGAEGGRACLSLTDADGCPPALVAARAAYAHPKQSERFLQCVATCLHFGADGSAGAVASTAEAAAAAAAAGSEIARRLLPLHFYAAALGAIDLLIHLVMKLLTPPPVPATTAAAPTLSTTLVHHPLSALSRPLETLSQGLGVLHFAAAHGQLSCVRLLLAHGAPPDQVDASGLLPTDHALRGVPGHVLPGEGHAECHLLLLRHLAR
jgi:ankyrin repeat protein